MEERRRHGFRVSKREIEERRRVEKRRKWDERLDRADLVRLQTELGSLNRAVFLTPQQGARKRLLGRMVRDLEQRTRAASGGGREPQLGPRCREPSASSSSADDGDGLFDRTRVEAAVRDNPPTKAIQLLPSSLRRRCNNGEVVGGGARKRARMAEEALLSSDTVGDNVEEFLDSL
ncbi:uncharacterized protein Tco025E_09447 [Trypanosoma conorhini]|uniref:Uncharacterized protein n=1 Tax=Trypanosoma conorhini TaxID=83891 RepID=A0A3R7JZ77_9TRYP|nr:uncharacterized protein Tco025E_09447 [Trypanosoma conorhini]RNE97812.1 hypothetical protein Tco025E_09447 [Trypanosoma conorhini]